MYGKILVWDGCKSQLETIDYISSAYSCQFSLLFIIFFIIFLGIQSLAQVVALSQEIKGSPATVMDNMSKSDLLNCQHSLTELILTGYAQKVMSKVSL